MSEGAKAVGLQAAQLWRRADLSGAAFGAGVGPPREEEPLGQARALAALRFGGAVQASGFNLFVIGPPQADLERSVRACLEPAAAARTAPDDWAYVHNFAEPAKPLVLRLPRGCAPRLRKAVADLIADLEVALPAAFSSDEYGARRGAFDELFHKKQEDAFSALGKEAAKVDVAIVRTPVGFGVVPTKNGEMVKPEEFEAIGEAQRRHIRDQLARIEAKLKQLLEEVPRWDKERRDSIRTLDRETARQAVTHSINETKGAFRDLPQVTEHLDRLEHNLLESAATLIAAAAEEDEERKSVLHQLGQFGLFEVNVLVSGIAGEGGAPVVEELHPTLGNLVGRIEHRWQQGILSTDFRHIRAGALHRANGGYLLIDARALLTEPFSYAALKRALRTGQIRIEGADEMLGLLSTQSLEPEPIALDVKIVLYGDRMLYYLLAALDPEFAAHFKVLADFDDAMDRDAQSELGYLGMLGAIQQRERLRPLDRGAAERVIEHAARLAEDASKLSLQSERIRDLLVEADYWAAAEQAPTITRAAVQQAIAERERRAHRVRDRLLETTLKDVALIATQGARVGQVNGLSVLTLGDVSFGRPTRITARVRPGSGRILDIEREVELGGPVHSKGVLILAGFLAGRFALDVPLSLQASLVFEQSYSGVEGDSASSAELYALLSALADLPLRQDLAATGAVNQLGEVQAIGGVNEKIEGFFDLCQARGLSGTQGVIIPAANVQHLMLRDDVVQACECGQFAVFAVGHVDEALALLTGREAGERDAAGGFPASSVNALVDARLREFAKVRRPPDGEEAASAGTGHGRRTS